LLRYILRWTAVIVLLIVAARSSVDIHFAPRVQMKERNVPACHSAKEQIFMAQN